MRPAVAGLLPQDSGILPPAPGPEASPYPEPDDINLDAPKPLPGAPFGMTPGVRHALPGIPMPNDPQAPAQAAPPEEAFGKHGIAFTDPTTGHRVELRPNLENTTEVRAKKIHSLGSALMDHAHTDQEKQAAERAAAWGLAQADTDVSVEHVIKDMDDSYRRDTGYENALARVALGNEGKIAVTKLKHPGGMGGGGPSLKQMKFDAEQDEKHYDDVAHIVDSESSRFEFKKTQENIQNYQTVSNLMSSDNPGSQNLAEAKALLALTGKQATTRELDNIRMMNGALDKWQSEARRYFPDPQKAQGYRRAFVSAMQEAMHSAQQYAAQSSERSVQRLRSIPWFNELSPHDQELYVSHIRGSLGGSFDAPADSGGITFDQGAPPPRQAPKAPAKKFNISNFVK